MAPLRPARCARLGWQHPPHQQHGGGQLWPRQPCAVRPSGPPPPRSAGQPPHARPTGTMQQDAKAAPWQPPHHAAAPPTASVANCIGGCRARGQPNRSSTSTRSVWRRSASASHRPTLANRIHPALTKNGRAAPYRQPIATSHGPGRFASGVHLLVWRTHVRTFLPVASRTNCVPG